MLKISKSGFLLDFILHTLTDTNEGAFQFHTLSFPSQTAPICETPTYPSTRRPYSKDKDKYKYKESDKYKYKDKAKDNSHLLQISSAFRDVQQRVTKMSQMLFDILS